MPQSPLAPAKNGKACAHWLTRSTSPASLNVVCCSLRTPWATPTHPGCAPWQIPCWPSPTPRPSPNPERSCRPRGATRRTELGRTRWTRCPSSPAPSRSSVPFGKTRAMSNNAAKVGAQDIAAVRAELIAAGFQLFPVRANAKVASVEGWNVPGKHFELKPHGNAAIFTGAHRDGGALLVLDVDMKDGRDG